MNRFLNKQLEWFFSEYQFKFETVWFKNFIYALLIFKSIFWLINYDQLFGANKIVFERDFSLKGLPDVVFYLYADHEPFTAYCFIIPLIILSALGIVFKKLFFIHDLFIWLIVANIHNKIYPTLTGGDNLLNQFLFFSCFLSASYLITDSKIKTLKIFIHNMACMAVITQVCLLYFLSGLAKYYSADWLTGAALADLQQIKHFNLYNPGYLRLPYSFLFLLNYLVMIYQLGFPILIWFKKIKKPILIIGVCMHLYIGFVMGLVEFSLVMLLPYIYFWRFKKAV
jgi:hypothetical protein